MISRYLFSSQSVTTFENCLHSHSLVPAKCSTNSFPNSSAANAEFFIACVASHKFLGNVPFFLSAYPLPTVAGVFSFSLFFMP